MINRKNVSQIIIIIIIIIYIFIAQIPCEYDQMRVTNKYNTYLTTSTYNFQVSKQRFCSNYVVVGNSCDFLLIPGATKPCGMHFLLDN